MISNDIIFNVSSFMLLCFLLLWGGCFFIFVYKNLGGAKVGKDSMLYFNYMFFKRDALSNCALVFLVLGYMSAAIAEYRRGADELLLMSNFSGGLAFFLFALYGKYFHQGFTDDKSPFYFIKVFLTKTDLSFGSIFLWLSRLAYTAWLIVVLCN
ncbi:hypothetical protein ACTUSZ_17785 [Pantoea eucalypti]|jgi:hypothetical protein|uniref:Uncharacterized protein n=1 Tax=Pantoea eucalypti TaxID=470933 RepID=A0ABY2ZIS4_9GAMM|nr:MULTISPECIES: hypothetical protein [Pantoea]MCD2358470.1 hypothetical protein [Pantoea sp. MHSD4]PQL26712.1 hypothetical protein C5L22_19005 [Pantoea ananatis]QGF28725.1 hypothetical protein EE896_18700 [Pantoea eucalypti]TPV36109.1 hypothetical protein FJW02_12550 [Pantoea eucalypti]